MKTTTPVTPKPLPARASAANKKLAPRSPRQDSDSIEVTVEQCHQMRDECVVFHLRRAERAVTEHYNAMLAESGITAPQVPLLAALRVHGPTPLGKLAKIVGLDPSTLSRNLSVLAKRGLVEMPSGEDRRVRRVVLSMDGQRALSQAYPRWTAAQRDVEALLGPAKYAEALASIKSLEDTRPRTKEPASGAPGG
jgi:DNA-binding MarR family transcriptional regulator